MSIISGDTSSKKISSNPNSQIGEIPTSNDLVDLPLLIEKYYDVNPLNKIAPIFFENGYFQGTSLDYSYNESHLVALTKSILDYRKRKKIDGPIFIGCDSHALSEPAIRTVIEVLSAADITLFFDSNRTFTPESALLLALENYNQMEHAKSHQNTKADGILITSFNSSPEFGGLKYFSPQNQELPKNITQKIAQNANALLPRDWIDIPRIPFEIALTNLPNCIRYDFMNYYIENLSNFISFKTLRDSKITPIFDVLGGSAIFYLPEIFKFYNLPYNLRYTKPDPTFSNLSLDADGQLHSNCNSPDTLNNDLKYLKRSHKYGLLIAYDQVADEFGVANKNGLIDPIKYQSALLKVIADKVSDDYRKSASFAADGIGKSLLYLEYLI